MRFKLIGLICLIMQCNLSCTQHIINKETVQTADIGVIFPVPSNERKV